LTKAGRNPIVLEKSHTVGGLSRTESRFAVAEVAEAVKVDADVLLAQIVQQFEVFCLEGESRRSSASTANLSSSSTSVATESQGWPSGIWSVCTHETMTENIAPVLKADTPG